ncbi:ABC transporter ATP-binding protein [Spiractinospora alimapuensis]|uniref:ABC transporter ATP-binding protein n=1 Tax=Spiractinospora alimapuensis TaxID=2820884 RepID=UPI001F309489|nr:ABC transporter ATP-binding protein [Spiractinospora alimapuensis]QVQ53716.1 ABC transporter ATP-binding protein [Spiractinospora alimapuensis]
MNDNTSGGADETSAPAVEVRGIGKRFPGVVANDDVTFSVTRGTVHALIGENGAGKSTLMKILYGMQRPDTGSIAVDGEAVSFSSPADAITHGIGMVHQHFMLADNLTVLENVVLGAERLHGIGARARARIRELSDSYGLGVQPDELMANLGVGARQRIEILKVLYRGARIIILDEPTAVLVPQEVDELFDNLRELRREGLTVLFISHKLDEVLTVADRITVIRRGTTVDTVVPENTSARELAALMVGGQLPVPELRESTVTDEVALDVRDLRVAAPDGRPVVDDVTLRIHKGEIVGIAGVEGNGQGELVEAIMGMRAIAGGTIRLGDREVTHWSTRDLRSAGIGFIPEDRHRHGLLLESPLWENRLLGHQVEPRFSAGPFLRRSAARDDANRIASEYDVRTPNVDVLADTLSGGNQQKFIVGREMSGEPLVLLAAHPTRGVDVGAQAAIWDQLRQARHQGLAVLLVSADLDELIGMSDTLHVILRGRLVAQVDQRTVTPEELGSAMSGARVSSDAADEATASDARGDVTAVDDDDDEERS